VFRHARPPSVVSMPENDPRRLLAWGAGAVVLIALAAWYALHLHHPGGGAAQAAASAPAISLESGGGGRVVVDVAGAVRHPGVYHLSAGARVNDALRRAGGTTRRADLTQINRAAKLEDGRQVLVPVRTPIGTGAAASGTGSTGPPAANAAPLNLNTATLEQLEALDGIGPAMAQRILDYRHAHGGFGSVEELGQVPGIGDKRLAALREKVRV
jgi:competence protein ComEA